MVGVGCATPILSLCVQLLRLWTSILDPPNPDVVVLVGIVASCIAHSHMLPNAITMLFSHQPSIACSKLT